MSALRSTAEWSDSLSGDGRLYAALEAKRMISVINLITANGEMVCVFVSYLRSKIVCIMCITCPLHLCVCVHCLCVCVCIINAVAQCE